MDLSPDRAVAPADPSLDRYARLVRRALDVPTAAVTVIEHDRQVHVGADGLGEQHQRDRAVPLTHSYCQYVVAQGEPLVVEDAREHPLLRDNPAITDLDAVAYAGWPVTDHTGRVVASVCAIDQQPHRWGASAIATLRDLAEACSAELAQRGLRDEALASSERVRSRAAEDRVLLALSEGLQVPSSLTELDDVVARAAASLGCRRHVLWVRPAASTGLVAAGPPAGPPEVSAPVGEAHDSGAERFGDDGRAVLPLTAGGGRVGVLELVWPDDAGMAGIAGHREAARALARHTARAVERIAVREERDALLGRG